MYYVLGIDIGTYSSKGLILDETGGIVAQAQTNHTLHIPRPGWAEHDPEGAWWRDFTFLTGELITSSGIDSGRIACVGISAIAPCVLPVDDSGTPLRRAILYGIDTRAVSQIEELNRVLGKETILKISGAELSAQSAGPKILWIKQNEPELWKRTARIMTSTSYLVFRLTGRSVMDYYTAAFYGPLYDLKKRGWNAAALSPICDASLLPELDWTAAVTGQVTPQAAAETGLAPGTPVITGTADAAAEAVSAGVSQAGDMFLMYGSTHFFIQVTSGLSEGDMYWPAEFVFPGSAVLAGGMATTGALTQWFAEQFAGSGDAHVFFALSEEASRVPPGSGGLLALPFFSGERTPMNDPLARGVIAGLTLSHSKAHVYRALLEGVGFGIRQNIEEMEKSAGRAKRIIAAGGGTKNRLWTQIISDIAGRDQLIFPASGAAYGDAVLAALGAGMLKSTDELAGWIGRGELISCDTRPKAMYDTLFQLYKRLYQGSREVVHDIASMQKSFFTEG